MRRTKHVKANDWRTVEWFFNANGVAFFLMPSGAQIKVRYGFGWVGYDRQKQTLNGANIAKLQVGAWSVTRARMQVKVTVDTDLVYQVFPGGNSLTTPELPF